jgi:hypothetical protein
MKYKLLVPPALVALLALSVYVRADANVRAERGYGEYLGRARAYAADAIVVDAAEQYKKALELAPSLALRMEITEFYASSGLRDVAADWCEDTADIYPREPEPYEYLMKTWFESGDFASCFGLYGTMTRRGAVSALCEGIMEELEYSYYLTGEYEDASAFGGGYCAVMTKGLWGYIDETGARRLRPMYVRAGAFGPDGRAEVTDERGDTYYIDTEGNKRAPPATPIPKPDAPDARDFSYGLAAVRRGGKWGYADAAGDMVIDCVFSDAGDFNSRGCALVKLDGSWRLLKLYKYNMSGR